MKRVKLFLRRLLPGQESDGDQSRSLSRHASSEVRERESAASDTSIASATPRQRPVSRGGADVPLKARSIPSSGGELPAQKPTPLECKLVSEVRKTDFGQTVHPKKEAGPTLASASEATGKRRKPCMEHKFSVVQPVKHTVAGIQEVTMPLLLGSNVHTRGTLRPGPLVYEEFCEFGKVGGNSNPLSRLKHSMQTQTSFRVESVRPRHELEGRESCASCLTDLQTPCCRENDSRVSSVSSEKNAGVSDVETMLEPDRNGSAPVTVATKVKSSCSDTQLSVQQSGGPVQNACTNKSKAVSTPQINMEPNSKVIDVYSKCAVSFTPQSTSNNTMESQKNVHSCYRGGSHSITDENHERSATLLVHSQSCAHDCQALSIPHKVCSKLSDKKMKFAVERSVHNGEEGFLFTSTPGSRQNTTLDANGRISLAKTSDLNFLTVDFNTKGLQTFGLNVMSCVSWSNIPNGLYLTDSRGLPVPEARLKIIPYPCPCHPLDQIIKCKRTPPDAEDTPSSQPSSGGGETRALPPTIAFGEQSDVSAGTARNESHERSSLKGADWPSESNTTNNQFLNASYDFHLGSSASTPEGQKTGAKSSEVCECPTVGGTQPVVAGGSSPTRISVRSLAAIAGQGVFRMVKESPIYAVSVALPKANALVNYIPSEFECKTTSDSSQHKSENKTRNSSGTICAIDDSIHATKASGEETSATENLTTSTQDPPVNKMRSFMLGTSQSSKVYSPTEFTEALSQTAKNKPDNPIESNTAIRIDSSSETCSRNSSKRLILKASRRSKRFCNSNAASVQNGLEFPEEQRIVFVKTEHTSVLTQPVGNSIQLLGSLNSSTQLPSEPIGANSFDKSLQQCDSIADHVQSCCVPIEDELHYNSAANTQGSETPKGSIKIPSTTKRPVSRKGNERRRAVSTRRSTRQSPEDERDKMRRTPELQPRSKKPPAGEKSGSGSTVQSLWLSQWTDKTFPSSKSIIRVSGEGSKIFFDCKDEELSGQSIQLNVADINENLRLVTECNREEGVCPVVSPDVCLGPPISTGSFSEDSEDQKQPTVKPTSRPQTMEAGGHPQLRSTTQRTPKTREAARFRPPFSFRARKQPISAVPEPNVATFECVVCTDYLSPPVRQCVTGHGLCPSCLKGAELCPICRCTVPVESNKALDSLVRTVLFPCKNYGAGCKESYWIEDRARHEARCHFRPRPCPFASRSQVMCGWSGQRTLIRGHMKRAHGHHGTVYAYRSFFPLEDFNLAAWANRTYHVEIVFVEHEIFELHKVFDRRNTCLWGLLRHILARDSGAQFSYSIRFQPANMRPNVTFRNDAVSGSEDLDKAFALGKRFNLHLDCFTQAPLDIFSVQLKVQPIDRNKWS